MEESTRCVAVLDVLGFRELIRTGSVVHLAKKLDYLVAAVPRVVEKWSTIETSSTGEDIISSRTVQLEKLLFSDTILLWSTSASAFPLAHHFEVCGFLQGVSYVLYAALLQGVPLRAGVAYGSVVIQPERGIALGQPIIDAYLTECAQEWIGGAIHDSYPPAASGYDQEYKVPVKRRAQVYLSRALNWTMHAREQLNASGTREGINYAVFKSLQQGFENAASSRAKKKYENTLKYVREIHDSLSNPCM